MVYNQKNFFYIIEKILLFSKIQINITVEYNTNLFTLNLTYLIKYLPQS